MEYPWNLYGFITFLGMGGPALRRSFFTRAGLPTAKVTETWREIVTGDGWWFQMGLPEDGVSMGIVYIVYI